MLVDLFPLPLICCRALVAAGYCVRSTFAGRFLKDLNGGDCRGEACASTVGTPGLAPVKPVGDDSDLGVWNVGTLGVDITKLSRRGVVDWLLNTLGGWRSSEDRDVGDEKLPLMREGLGVLG